MAFYVADTLNNELVSVVTFVTSYEFGVEGVVRVLISNSHEITSWSSVFGFYFFVYFRPRSILEPLDGGIKKDGYL